MACQCFDICIRVCVVLTLSQCRSSFGAAGVVGIVDSVHQVGLDGVIRDTKVGQCSSSGGRITLVGLQNIGDLWVTLDSVGDDISGTACGIRATSNRATCNKTKRRSLRDLFSNITGLVKFVQLTFQCSLRNTFLASFGSTFFDGYLCAGLGKIAEGLHGFTQTCTSPT